MSGTTSDLPELQATEIQETFQISLEHLINRHCMENDSNTPDWILAQYMMSCLKAFNVATQQRENWHDRDPRPTHTKYGVAIEVEDEKPIEETGEK